MCGCCSSPGSSFAHPTKKACNHASASRFLSTDCLCRLVIMRGPVPCIRPRVDTCTPDEMGPPCMSVELSAIIAANADFLTGRQQDGVLIR
jgi:hypothetical protein